MQGVEAYLIEVFAIASSELRKTAMMSITTIHTRICAKSPNTRSNVVHRPVLQQSSLREMVVVGERPLADIVLDTLDCRE